MTFQSVPDCAEAVIHGTFGGKNIANVLGFHMIGGYDLTAIELLADIVDQAVGDFYLDLMHDQCAYIGTLVRGLTDENDLQAVDSDNAGNGTLGAAPMPANVSSCITLRSGLTGRSARGRFYAFPTNAGQTDGINTFSATYIANLEDFLNAIKSVAAAVDWDLSILSRFHNNEARPVGIPFKVVTIAARNRTMDSQRGRLPAGH